jgi:pteridine reductase
MSGANARALEGRAALVTGGGTRVGRAIAEELGRRGAHVAVHYLTSEAGAQAACDTIRVDGSRAVALKANLADAEACPQLLTRATAELGPLSILVNSAAIYGHAYTADDFWKVNARAPYLLTEAFATAAIGPCDVVNILDVGGVLNTWKGEIPYTMSKAAAADATRSFAVKLAPKIRVNAVAPGTVLPPDGMSAEQLEALRIKIPQQRFGSAQDVADAVALLLTGPAFVTGQILAVDGGRSLAL